MGGSIGEDVARGLHRSSKKIWFAVASLRSRDELAECEIKGQSSSNSQNVAFVSLKHSSTNEAVNTAHEVSTASSHGQVSSLTYADNVMLSFFSNQSNSPQLDNKDLEQIDIDDLEEMDLKWAPRNQGNRNGDAPRRVVPVELLQMPWLFKMG
ncbi:hypothetical protein Tco_0537039 [Tanacetum coccineum]